MRRLLLPVLFLAVTEIRADDLPPGAFARAGGTSLRHPERPTALAFSADGARLASGGTDGTFRVWDVATGAELHRAAGPEAAAVAVAFSADGSLLAASFGDRKVRLYDARTYRLLRAIPSGDLESLALTRDGKLVGGATVGTRLVVTEAANGLERVELPPGYALAFAPDGSAVAASDEEDRVTIYQLPSGKPLLTVRHPNRDGVTSVAYSADGSKLATADTGETGRVRVWDARTGERLAECVGEAPVAFRSSDQVVARRGRTVVVWSLADAKPVRELDAGTSLYAVSPDGRRLATAGYGTRIRLWDLTTGGELGAIGRDVTGLVADGRSDVLVPTTGGLARWSPTKGGLVEVKHAADTGAVVVAGKRLVGTSNGRVGVWDDFDPARPPAEPSRLIDGVGGTLRGAWANADGTRVALLTGERSLAVADPASGKVLRSWDAPAVVLAAALAPAGDRLTAALRDGFVRCWDLTAAGSGAARGGVVGAGPARPLRLGRVPGRNRPPRRRYVDGPGDAIRRRHRLPDRRVRAEARRRPVPLGRPLARRGAGRGRVPGQPRYDRRLGDRHSLGRPSLHEWGGDRPAPAVPRRRAFARLCSRRRRPARVGPLRTGGAAEADGRRAAVRVGPARPRRPGRRLPAGLDVGGRRADGVAAVRAGLARAGETRARVAKLIAELDARSFRDRERAGTELLALGSHALPALIEAAQSHRSPEVRQRAEDALTVLRKANVEIPAHGLFGEPLRQTRTVAALEAIGSPDAVKALEEIRKAGGRSGDEADRALKRMTPR